MAAERMSMLEAKLERLDRTNRPQQPLSRMCLVGRAADGVSADEVVEWHETKVRAVQQHVMDLEKAHGDSGDTSSAVTGMLICLPTGWLHVVECSHATLSELLLAFTDGVALDKLRDVKVVATTDDIAGRSFVNWSHKQLDVQRGNFQEVDATTMPALLADTTISMLKLGKALCSLSRDEANAKLDAWSTAFADFMPSNERVEQLLEMSEIMSLSEFVAIYQAPSVMTLTEEKVWPMNRPLVY